MIPVRPFLNKTNDVNVGFHHLQILKVDDFDCTITMSLLTTFRWIEPRIIGPSYKPDYYVSLGRNQIYSNSNFYQAMHANTLTTLILWEQCAINSQKEIY